MFKSQKFKLILVLIVCTVFAYASSLGNPFIWDDEQFINVNIDIQHFRIVKIFTEDTIAGAGGGKSNYYRPLTSLSFAIDTKLWGNNPTPFHIVNISLHTGAGILLFLVLGLLGMSTLPAFFISLFFLVFPSQVEAVTYINSRGDSLFALLFLLSIYVYVWALSLRNIGRDVLAAKKLTEHQLRDGRRRTRNLANILLISSAFLYTLSILAKETALFGLPLYGVTLWVYSLRQGKSIRSFLRLSQFVFLAGLVTIGTTYFLLRMTVLNFANTLNYYSVANVYSQHLLIRLYTFCKILFVYLGILVWPYPLHMERGVNVVFQFLNIWVLSAIVLVGGLFWLALYIYKSRKNYWMLFGFLWSAIFLIPVSGFIPINGLLYEHWLYLPMIGFWIMIYGIVQFTIFKLQFSDKFVQTVRKIFLGLGILLAGIYIVLTIHQNNIWEDPVVFYQYTLQFAPKSPRIHNNLGISLDAAGRIQEAITEYKKAIDLVPYDPYAYNNLGNLYLTTGKYDLAEKYLSTSLKLAPGFFTARANLVKMYIITKRYDKARELSGNNPIVEQVIKAYQAQQQTHQQ